MSRKGSWATEASGKTILTVVLIISMVAMLFIWLFPNFKDLILKIREWGGLGTPIDGDNQQITSKLTAPIQCAYVRCSQGCDAAKNIKEGGFSCSDFCNTAWQDDEGKICDENAKLYSVEFKVNDIVKIQKAELRKLLSIPDKTNFCIAWTADFKEHNPTLLLIDENLVDKGQVEKEVCMYPKIIGPNRIDPAMKHLEIHKTPANLYIFSIPVEGEFGITAGYNTYIWNEMPLSEKLNLTISESDSAIYLPFESLDLPFEERTTYRIKIVDGDGSVLEDAKIITGPFVRPNVETANIDITFSCSVDKGKITLKFQNSQGIESDFCAKPNVGKFKAKILDIKTVELVYTTEFEVFPE